MGPMSGKTTFVGKEWMEPKPRPKKLNKKEVQKNLETIFGSGEVKAWLSTFPFNYEFEEATYCERFLHHLNGTAPKSKSPSAAEALSKLKFDGPEHNAYYDACDALMIAFSVMRPDQRSSTVDLYKKFLSQKHQTTVDKWCQANIIVL